MIKLIEGKVYWIKRNSILTCEVGTNRPIRTELLSSLVRVEKYCSDKKGYYVMPMAWDIGYFIKEDDILDAVIVENPFKDVKEDV